MAHLFIKYYPEKHANQNIRIDLNVRRTRHYFSLGEVFQRTKTLKLIYIITARPKTPKSDACRRIDEAYEA